MGGDGVDAVVAGEGEGGIISFFASKQSHRIIDLNTSFHLVVSFDDCISSANSRKQMKKVVGLVVFYVAYIF